MKTNIGTRMIRREMFAFLGAVMAGIIILLWAAQSMGAGFQPVPTQAFGLHWGMPLEEAEKVRALKKADELEKFTMYVDTGFTPEEMPGVVGVLYVFMNNRLGGAFLRLHCENDAMVYIQIFSSMHGMPTSIEKGSGLIGWETAGNVVQVSLAAGAVVVGNRKIMEMANEAMEEAAKKSPQPEKDNSPPVIEPGPRTES